MAKKGYIGAAKEAYKVLEYIESTGLEHIFTGVIISQATINRTVIELDSQHVRAGSQSISGMDATGVCLWGGILSTATMPYCWSNGKTYGTTGKYGDFEVHTYTMDGVNGRYTIDDIVEKNIAFSCTNTDGVDFTLCKSNRGNGTFWAGPTIVHGFRAWLDGIQIRNMIPCLSPSGEVGMYDLVTEEFFGNDGTGTFVAGAETGEVIERCVAQKTKKVYIGATQHNLPKGYTELEYIQTSGTQYIDTGINGHMGYDYELIFQFLDGGAVNTDVWGVSDTSDWSYRYNMSFTYGSLGGMCLRITLDDVWLSQIGYADTAKHTYKIKDGKWYLDSNVRDIPEDKRSYAFSHHPYLGGINYAGGRKTLATPAKYFSYRVWGLDGNLMQHFVPCINPDNAVGMYDLVTSSFYGNSGTGAFVAGAAVNSVANRAKKIYIGDDNGIARLWLATDPWFVPIGASKLVTADGKIFCLRGEE